LFGDDMNIETIWDDFLSLLTKIEPIEQASYKKAAGIPFLYIRAREDCRLEVIEKAIRLSSAASMKGKQLHSETAFVRNENDLYIFRHRFYVPLRKMFCCGNLCSDCIRFRSENL
jgi:hypothetical protein